MRKTPKPKASKFCKNSVKETPKRPHEVRTNLKEWPQNLPLQRHQNLMD